MKNRPPSNDGEVATQKTVAIAIQTPISTAAGRSRRNIPIAPATGSHCSNRFDQENSRTCAIASWNRSKDGWPSVIVGVPGAR